MSAGLHVLATRYSCPLFARRRTTMDPRGRFGKNIRNRLAKCGRRVTGRILRLARKSRFLTARQEPGRAKKAPGGNGIPGGQRIPLRFRERLDVSFRGLPCRGTICQNVVSSSQAVDKTAASIRANRHRLAVRENQASLPCRLVREATTRRHPSDERNGNKARFRPAPVRVALLVTTIGGRYEIHAAGSSAFFLSYEISQFTISPEAALVNSFHALA